MTLVFEKWPEYVSWTATASSYVLMLGFAFSFLNPILFGDPATIFEVSMFLVFSVFAVFGGYLLVNSS